MLILLILLPTVFAKEAQKQYPIVRPIDSCPDVGYFFKREIVFNAIQPGKCYLCFCQDNDSVLCWPRKNKRCDIKHYHHDIKKRNLGIRVRRNPGFSDIFLRDAARDVFDRQESSQQCKPYESSYSDGCPPADWCIGCTVCDCDANGRWDCHILSFCPNDKGKSKPKRRQWTSSYRGRNKRNRVKRQLSTSKKPQVKPKKNTSQPKKTTKKPPVRKSNIKNSKPNVMQLKQSKVNNMKYKLSKQKVNNVQQKGTKNVKKVNNNKTKVTNNKKKVINNKNTKHKQQLNESKKGPIKQSTPKKPQQSTMNTKQFKKTKKGLVIKPTRKPVAQNFTKNKRDVLQANNTAIFAQTIVKHVMASVEKILNESQKKLKKTSNAKVVQKRSMYKNSNKKILDKYKDKTKANYQQMSLETKHQMKAKQKLSPKKFYPYDAEIVRKKRDLTVANNHNSTPPMNNGYLTVNSVISTQKIATGRNLTRGYETNELNTDRIVVNNFPLKPAENHFYYKYNLDLLNNADKIKNVNQTNMSLKKMAQHCSITNENMSVSNVAQKQDYMKNILKHIILPKPPFIILKLNVPNNKTSNTSKKFNESNFGNNCGKMCDIRSFFNRLTKHTLKKNYTDNSADSKKVMTYVSTFFKNIFRKSNRSTKVSKNMKGQGFHKRSIIETLCRRIGPCKFNYTDKALQSKLQELKMESRNILKSVNIIKGLLKLLESNDNKNKLVINTTYSETPCLEKLKAILHESYGNEKIYINLTETQRLQVNYIKQNIQVFVEAIERFSYILNDLIKMLTNHHYLGTKNISYVPHIDNNKNNQPNVVSAKLDKLKKLLFRSNLLQNNFMKKMYEVVLRLEKHEKSTKDTKYLKVSGDKVIKADIVENYTKDILKNLRKLESLTKKLSFKIRRKREYMGDDDAMDYLLTLMEYFLKKKTLTDVSPVNDGIDLLIDAIKTAPNIKSIKKKVLQFIPLERVSSDSEYSKELKEVKIVDKNNKETEKLQVQRFKAIDLDDSENEGDYHSINEKYEKILNLNDVQPTENVYINSTEKTTQIVDIINKTKFKKFKDDILENKLWYETRKSESKRFQVFSDEYEEEMTTGSSTTELIKETSTSNELVEIETSTNINIKDVHPTPDIYSHDDLKIKNTKTKLDWIEENFDRDSKFLNITETTTQSIIKTATRTAKKNKDKYADPIDSASVELDNKKQRSKKVGIEYEVAKKQMDILNSLDYGTEKAEIDIDSKEYKYNSDSYFV